YIHLAIVGFWVAVNAGLTPLEKFDPTFVLLATIASVEAIFLTSFVLVNQNRMQADADRRADLDLQISLLTEHALTRVPAHVRGNAEAIDVEPTDDADVKEIESNVETAQELDAIEKDKLEHRKKGSAT